jgi:hypothetical protein
MGGKLHFSHFSDEKSHLGEQHVDLGRKMSHRPGAYPVLIFDTGVSLHRKINTNSKINRVYGYLEYVNWYKKCPSLPFERC